MQSLEIRQMIDVTKIFSVALATRRSSVKRCIVTLIIPIS
jgi:hypothetical protein